MGREGGDAAPGCSEWALSQGLRPVGTAGYYRGFVLVEQPLPWPSDVADLEELRPLHELASTWKLRLQAIVPRVMSERRRVISYLPRSAGWAEPLVRHEKVAAVNELAKVVEAMLVSGDEAMPVLGEESVGRRGLEAHGRRSNLELAPNPDVLDVLVCAHGRRDVCCGSHGSRLYADLDRVRSGKGLLDGPAQQRGWVDTTSRALGPGGLLGTEVRVWRTSHTGGHRFAPTVVVLPLATMWAWVDVPLLERILIGSAIAQEPGYPDRDDVRGHYRGCSLIGPGAHQALEGAALLEAGWSLLRAGRRVRDLGNGRFALESTSGARWTAVVAEGRRVLQPDCRTEPARAMKSGIEWTVRDLQIDGPGT